MNTSNWDDLILGLERALSASRRLREYYSPKHTGDGQEIPILPEGLSVKAMLVEIAKLNGGKLVIKEAITIVASHLQSDRECARNSIYVTLNYWCTLFIKLSKGVYQLVPEKLRDSSGKFTKKVHETS